MPESLTNDDCRKVEEIIDTIGLSMIISVVAAICDRKSDEMGYGQHKEALKRAASTLDEAAEITKNIE